LYARGVADQAKRRTKAAHILAARGISEARLAEINSVHQAFHRKCTVHSQDFNRPDTICLMRPSGRLRATLTDPLHGFLAGHRLLICD
jgi:hypothetical protein